jgi:hypothetical protein
MPKLVRGRNRRRFWLRSVGHFESGDGSLGSTGRREKGMNVFGFDRGAGSGMILTLIMRPCMLNATNGAKNATISAASRRPMIITLPLPFTPAMAEANLSQAPMLSERVANFSFPSQIYPPCPPFPHNQSIPRRNAQRKGGGQSQSGSLFAARLNFGCVLSCLSVDWCAGGTDGCAMASVLLWRRRNWRVRGRERIRHQCGGHTIKRWPAIRPAAAARHGEIEVPVLKI